MKKTIGVLAILLFSVCISGGALAAGTWTSIGPWGGDVRGIAVDPFDSSTVYAVTYGSGVFKSTDSGTTWAQAGLTGSSLTALVVDPVTEGTLYAGANDGKVYRSTDAGLTWGNYYTGLPTATSRLVTAIVALDGVRYASITDYSTGQGIYKRADAESSWSASNAGLSSWRVEALVADPVSPGTLYAGTNNGGAFKSTDGGTNWSGLTNSPSSAWSLAVDPATPSTVYVGTYAGGVYNSTDSGENWSAASTGMGNAIVYALAVAPDASATVYAATSWGLYKSTDGGANWSAASTGMESGSVSELALDPAALGTIYAGGRSTPLYKSTDSGANWSEASDGLWCWDFQTLAFDPLTSSLYAGDYGVGVMKTTDWGANWNKANSGLTTTVQTLVVDPSNSYLYAGTYNGIFNSTDGGANWSAINSGLSGLDTDFIAVDPADSNVLFAVTSGGLHKSINGGTNWAASGGGAGSVHGIAFSPTAVFAGSYGSGGGVFKSIDGGTNWTATNTGLTTTNIHTIAVSPADPSVMYAGAWAGTAFRSIDGGANWAEASAGMNPMYLYSLLLHPTDPDTLYAGTSDGVYKSTNGGGLWTPMNVGLVESRANDLAMDPSTPHVIYAVGLHSAVQKLEITSDIRVPGTLDFGELETGQSSTQTVTVENAGVASLAVGNMQITGTGASQFSLDVTGGAAPCGTASPTILASDGCTVSVTFSPTYGGTPSAVLTITSDDPQKPTVDVALSGTGTLPPAPYIQVSPYDLSFGLVTEGTDSYPYEVTIYNWGTGDLEVSDMQITGTDAAEFSLDVSGGYYPCGSVPTTVSPSDYMCTVSVKFSPTSTGTKSTYLVISSNDPGELEYYVYLYGEGTPVPVPAIALEPLSIAFGNITEGTGSAPVEVTVNNGGTAELAITDMLIGGTDPAEFILNVSDGAAPCGNTSLILPAGESCTVSVTFGPSVAASMSASLEISSDDPDMAVASVALTGTGTPTPVPDISVAPAAVSFGGIQELATSASQAVTIISTGALDLNVSAIALGGNDPGEFAIGAGGTCGGSITLALGESCTVEVSFTPSTTGAMSANLEISSGDPDTPAASVALTGAGTATPVSNLRVTDSLAPGTDLQITFADTTEGITSAPEVVSMENTGTGDLGITNITITGGNPGEFAIVAGGTCGTLPVTLLPYTDCTVEVAFAPSTTGAMSASLDITSDGGSASVALTGTGLSSATNNAPVAPVLVTPEDGTTGLASPVLLGWNASTDPDGDTLSYQLYVCDNQDFSGCETPLYMATYIASASYENRGISLSGTGIGLVLIGMALSGGLSRRRKLALLLAALLMAGALLGACGGGGTTPVSPGSPTGDISFEASALESGAAYYWKVAATDGTDSTPSAVWSFTTK
jgi:photosystem II stability/assembly factor-like uncharacterized protein